MNNETPTVRRFSRSLSDAFPSDRANAITCYRRRPNTALRLLAFFVIGCIAAAVVLVLCSTQAPNI